MEMRTEEAAVRREQEREQQERYKAASAKRMAQEFNNSDLVSRAKALADSIARRAVEATRQPNTDPITRDAKEAAVKAGNVVFWDRGADRQNVRMHTISEPAQKGRLLPFVVAQDANAGA
jgi:hypothetical protein